MKQLLHLLYLSKTSGLKGKNFSFWNDFNTIRLSVCIISRLGSAASFTVPGILPIISAISLLASSVPYPAIFVPDLQDANKKIIFPSEDLRISYSLKVHSHHSSNIKVISVPLTSACSTCQREKV
jgi:hypothetical protein